MKPRDLMSTRVQLFCVWCGPVGLVLYLIFFALISKFVPPPSPHWTTAHVVSFYAHNTTRIRIGQLGAFVASTLFLPVFTVIAYQISRTEPRAPILAFLEWGGGMLLMGWFGICAMVWMVATYRSGLSPNTLRAFNDFAWIAFVAAFPGYLLQVLALAAAVFRDRSPHPVWPRWAGYLNLWIAVSGIGGGFAVFAKTGPIAWNGVIGFWIPVCMFGLWLSVNTYLLHTGINRQAVEAERSVTQPAVSPAAANPVAAG
jgi:hypothetical protein